MIYDEGSQFLKWEFQRHYKSVKANFTDSIRIHQLNSANRLRSLHLHIESSAGCPVVLATGVLATATLATGFQATILWQQVEMHWQQKNRPFWRQCNLACSQVSDMPYMTVLP